MVGGSWVAHAESLLPFPPEETAPDARVLLGDKPLNGSVHENADGSFQLTGSQAGGSFNGGFSWNLQWDLTVKEDPFIIGSLTLTNLATDTRSFNLTLSLPITPSFSPSLFGGSVHATLLDQNGDGSAFLGTNSMSPSIYRGTIDGVTVLSLFAGSVTCGGSGPSCGSTISFDDGLPGPTLPGPAVVSNIGTFLNFSLSGGDKVTFLTNFTVEPPAAVPLPAAAPLLILGFGVLAAARRRRGGKPQ
ncbi:MAG: VPLPA-CTERM sorting domain-containing protein [Pseudomonadota bacterium]